MKHFKLKMENATSVIVTDVEEKKDYVFNDIKDIPIIECAKENYSPLATYFLKAVAFCFGYKNNYKDDKFTLEIDISCFQHLLIEGEIKSYVDYQIFFHCLNEEIVLANIYEDVKYDCKKMIGTEYISEEDSQYGTLPSHEEILKLVSNGVSFDIVMFGFGLDYIKHIERFLYKYPECNQYLPE